MSKTKSFEQSPVSLQKEADLALPNLTFFNYNYLDFQSKEPQVFISNTSNH